MKIYVLLTLLPESGFRIAPNWHVNWKNDTDVTIFWHDVIVKFFWLCFVSLVKVSYWSKFHVNIITGSGVMTIYLYKELPEIQKLEIPPSEFCPIFGDWGK